MRWSEALFNSVNEFVSNVTKPRDKSKNGKLISFSKNAPL